MKGGLRIDQYGSSSGLLTWCGLPQGAKRAGESPAARTWFFGPVGVFANVFLWSLTSPSPRYVALDESAAGLAMAHSGSLLRSAFAIHPAGRIPGKAPLPREQKGQTTHESRPGGALAPTCQPTPGQPLQDIQTVQSCFLPGPTPKRSASCCWVGAPA